MSANIKNCTDNHIELSLNLTEYKKKYCDAYKVGSTHLISGAAYLAFLSQIVINTLSELAISSIEIDKFISNRVCLPCQEQKSKYHVIIHEIFTHVYNVDFLHGKNQKGSDVDRSFTVNVHIDMKTSKKSPQHKDKSEKILSSKQLGIYFNDVFNYGVYFNESFRSLQDLSICGGAYICKVFFNKPSKVDGDFYTHEVTNIYNVFHTLTLFLSYKSAVIDNAIYLPSGFASIELFYTRYSTDHGLASIVYDEPNKCGKLSLISSNNEKIIEINKFTVMKITTSRLLSLLDDFLEQSHYKDIVTQTIANQIKNNLTELIECSITTHKKYALIASIIYLLASKLVKIKL